MTSTTGPAGEIAMDVDEQRAGDVRLVVLVATLVMVGEIEAAIAHDGRSRQLRIGEPGGEILDSDE